MKKILATLLLLSLTLFGFASCADEPENTEPEAETMSIGYLTGPTGIGMAKLINDYKNVENAKYTFKNYKTDQTAAMGELLTGKIDAICLPTNVAAKYYKAQNENCYVLAINTLNTLFFITDGSAALTSLSDLNGKTVYTCSNGTPKIILEALLEKADVEATVKTEVNGQNIVTPDDLRAQIIAGKVNIAFAPEPIISAAKAARQKAGLTPYDVDLNCDTLWKQNFTSELAMGCLVVSADFADKNPNFITKFLSEYEASIDYISNPNNIDSAASYVAEAGILPSLPVAKSAITNLGNSIDLITGSDMKNSLEGFYKVINEPLPDRYFYYEN